MSETAEDLLKIGQKAPPGPDVSAKAKALPNTNPKSQGRNARRHPIHESFWVEFKMMMKREGLDQDSFYRAGIDGSTLQKMKEWFAGNGGPLTNLAPQTCKKLVDMVDKPNLFRSEIRTIADLRDIVKSGV
ncbi:MAG: hypothetical protein ACPGJO_11110 [bacterium]